MAEKAQRAVEGELVGYARLAELLGVKVDSARSLGSDGRLPKPVARYGNSPVWSATDVNAFIDERERGTGRQGHPSRVELRARGARKDAAFAHRVRAAVASGRAPVASLKDLAARIGLAPATLNNRLEGRARWKPEELKALAKLLGEMGEPDNVRR